MIKSMFVGAAALMLSAGAAAAGEWEAIAISDGAVMAADWESLRINGSTRRINTALVAVRPEAGQFDWATSLLDVDCAGSRYKTIRSSFFYMDGTSASGDFIGDDSWTTINPGSLMEDMREAVCEASPGKDGYFDDPQTFAVNARRVMLEQ